MFGQFGTDDAAEPTRPAIGGAAEVELPPKIATESAKAVTRVPTDFITVSSRPVCIPIQSWVNQLHMSRQQRVCQKLFQIGYRSSSSHFWQFQHSHCAEAARSLIALATTSNAIRH